MLTIRQVSERLGRCQDTVRRMITDGRLRGYRDPKGRIGIPAEAVLEYETGMWLPIEDEPCREAAAA